jgi:hypothetical protein
MNEEENRARKQQYLRG